MLLSDFLNSIYVPSKIGLSDGWVRQLAVTAGQFERWAGPTDVADLTDDLLSGFLRHRYQSGTAPSTINSQRARLLALWRCAWRKRLHAELPRDVPRAPVVAEEPEAWLLSEIEALLHVAQRWGGNVNGSLAQRFWPALILTIYDTGLRIGATLAILDADVDLEHRSVMARGRSQKNRTGQRLRISEQTAAALTFIRSAAYPTLFNWPFTQQHLTRRFRKIIDAAGLPQPDKPFHKLRRSNASYCLAAGGDPTAQLGHSSPSVTRAYLDPRIVRRQQAADILPRPKF